MITSIRFYNCISSFYSIIDFFLSHNRDKLIRTVNADSNNVILDIGIANGTYLRKYSALKIFGIDTSIQMIERARANNNDKYDIRLMSGENLKFEENMFDAIVLSHVISVVNDSSRLMDEVSRVVKENGKVYVLNHFTHRNIFRYFDKIMKLIGYFFFFETEFYEEKVLTHPQLSLDREIILFPFGYFKILVLRKI